MPPLKNRVGQIYGRLTVIAQAESHNKQTCWLCRCICGIEVVRSGHDLHRGASLSCGCLHRETAAALRFKDLTGQVFGRLTVISRAPNHQKKVRWNCQCECGATVIASTHLLQRGEKRSCGCLARDVLPQINFKHGEAPSRKHPAATKEYRAWRSMISRCYDEKNNSHPNYGGRGIQVCDRWRNDYLAFLADMRRAPEGFSLDRIDPDGDYTPENCRWASYNTQSRNRRVFILQTCAYSDCASTDWKFCPYCGRPLTERR